MVVAIAPSDLALVSFTAKEQTIYEDGGTVTVTVSSSTTLSDDLFVPIGVYGGSARSGEDYQFSASQIIIPAGTLSGAATIQVLNDSRNEPSETVNLQITAPAGCALGTNSVHAVTIRDDDPLVSLVYDSPDNVAGCREQGSAWFDVRLSAPSNKDVTVFLSPTSASARSGWDYTISPDGPVVIPADSFSVRRTVSAVDDNVAEE